MNLRSDNFARWLEATMQSRGLSQAAIARRVGVADAQVSRWRRGQVTPSLPHLQRIADTFGVPRVELDRLAGYPVPGEPDTGADDPEAAAELRAHLAQLERLLTTSVPPELWRAYIDACEALAASLATSFTQAQEQIESARESSRRPIGFHREDQERP
jgi:transcriptional regulator with XRE-family HTH domain